MAVADSTAEPARARIATAKIADRRAVHYENLEELLADAERLAKGPYRQLGNWTLGMIARHIATALDMGLDGHVPRMPRPVQWLACWLLKKKLIAGPMPAGKNVPAKVARVIMPQATDDAVGVELLRKSIHRWQNNSVRHPHPFFGRLTDSEWNQLELRHAELHMSFLVPI